MKQQSVRLTFAWHPDHIGGNRLIIDQDNRIEDKADWAAFTDVVHALANFDFIETVDRHKANKRVYELPFPAIPTLEQVRTCIAAINAAAAAAGFDWYKGARMHPTLADRIRSPEDATPDVRSLIAGVADGSVTSREIKRLRDLALTRSVAQLQSEIDAGRITYREAWTVVHTLVVGPNS